MQPLKRLPDWRSRFEAAIDEIKRTPFAWAEHDCGPPFAGRIVEALTGIDLAAPYRGRYRSREEALTVMQEAGFDDLADMVASLLPEIEEGPCLARIGDVVTFPVDTEFKSSLGVVNGERVFVLRPEGIGTMELLQAKRAFRVG